MDQLNQQKALIDNLMKDREKVGEKLKNISAHCSVIYVFWSKRCVCPKLDSLEDMFMNMSSQDRESSSEAAPGSEEADSKASLELRQQISYLR